MEDFTNEVLDLGQLPRYEAVSLERLQSSYWKVVLIKIAFIFLLIGVLLGVAVVFEDDVEQVQGIIWSSYSFLLVVVLFFCRLSFQKKGFAFREHDVIYRHGIIATNTMVIPYNRVQHVALHEGLIERWFGLAAVEIFTAGGSDSDLKIPGIEKTQAEDIKQLLMGKIQVQL
ncbi:PH domain-containing protein [Flavobacterium capsici]|uniref:PH domain-containing protein n=1 Tax=Flavobacterium capsici TaxID=3075618 RepID=A0AA96J2V1_9FLAO|nr:MULTISPECIES: PH domain-containing protein [unclassified Flavobacterium]WNM18553.1 PH domain-containing protein [Flavobacterium sp. PMR2A8]WNM22604.1 PH domain-containing protein [Flavobacterium sp. PMTSA4]